MRISWVSWLSFFVFFVGLTLFSTSFYLRKEMPDPGSLVMNAILPQQIRSIPVDADFRFAGERIATDQFDIRERLERELLVQAYQHSATMLSLKRTARYFPEMERIFKEENMPEDLKFLAVAESNLMNATSSAGAKGIWQFMEPTGKAFDLEINSEIDERLHLEKATRAACRYLRTYKEKYGSWQLAACAYNMGGPRLEKEMREQRATSFDELNLNTETSRYLFKILAYKTILENPGAYGYDLAPEEYYTELNGHKEVKVSGAVENWGDFAKSHGTNYRMLKVYNPWLMTNKLTNKAGKTYTVLIPVGKNK